LTASPLRFKSLPVFILQRKDCKTELTPFVFPSWKLVCLGPCRRASSKITQPVEVFSKVRLDLMEIVCWAFVLESLRFPILLFKDAGKFGTAS
jgi:hypothetical protein